MSDWALALSSSIFPIPGPYRSDQRCADESSQRRGRPRRLARRPRRGRRANRTVKRYAVGKVGRFSHRGIDPGFVYLEGRNPLPETGRIAGSPQSWNRRGAASIRRRLCGGDLLGLQIHSDDQFSTQSFGCSPLAPGGKLAQLGTRGALRSSGVRERPSNARLTIPTCLLPLPFPRRERSEQVSSWALTCSRMRLGTPLLPLEGRGREGVNWPGIQNRPSSRTTLFPTARQAHS